MFCPRCGSNQSEELKFCKLCGGLAEIVKQAARTGSSPEKDTNPLLLRSAETNEFIPSGFSVTEETTKHLRGSDYKQ